HRGGRGGGLEVRLRQHNLSHDPPTANQMPVARRANPGPAPFRARPRYRAARRFCVNPATFASSGRGRRLRNQKEQRPAGRGRDDSRHGVQALQPKGLPHTPGTLVPGSLVSLGHCEDMEHFVSAGQPQ
ncbi:MAG TPA: hypothetical protein VF395_18980, partial [Polyangiaceae bacterium]